MTRDTDKHGAAFRVTYPDGFWFLVGLDTGVVEVTAQPQTRESYQANHARIQGDIFEFADSLGLRPHERIGGGHHNLGLLSAFGNPDGTLNELMFRNFLVEQANHPELPWGILGNHLGNAPPFSALSAQQQGALERLIREYDLAPSDPYWLVRQVERLGYTAHPNTTSEPYRRNRQYYHDLSFRSVNSDLGPLQRVEMRGVRPQASLDQFLLEVELLDIRLDRLRIRRDTLPLRIPPSHQMTQAETRERFRRLLRSLALPFERYEGLLLPALASVPPSPRSIPYAEDVDELGRRRSHNEWINRIRDRIPEAERTRFGTAARAASGGDRDLLPYPRVLREDDWRTIREGTHQRARVVRAFFEDILSGNNRAMHAGIMPADVWERVIRRHGLGERLPLLRADTMAIMLAPDIIQIENGEFRVLEDNVDTNAGGQGDMSGARQDLLDLLPEYRSVLRMDESATTGAMIARRLRTLSPHPGGEGVMILWNSPSNRRHILLLQKAGVQVFDERGAWIRPEGSPYERAVLDSSGRSPVIRFYTQGATVPALSSPVSGLQTRGLSLRSMEEYFPKTFQRIQEGAVGMVAPSEADFLGDKELSIYYERLIPFYLNEQPVLRYVPTVTLGSLDGEGHGVADEARIREVFANPQDYVVKAPDGLQGKQVWIGAKMNAAELTDLSALVRANPQNFIAQEYHRLSVVGESIVDLRTYAIASPDGTAHVAARPWGRALSVHGDGKVNMSQRGVGIATFVEGLDTIEPSAELRGELMRRAAASECPPAGLLRRALDLLTGR